MKEFVENSGILAAPENDIYPDGFNSTSVDTFCLEDGVSYRASGVPHFVNIPGFDKEKDKNWNRDRYHTVADDKDTYNADVMTTNLKTFGALAIYVDQTPALKLDMTATCDDLDEALNEDLAKAADADTEAYKAASKALRASVDSLNKNNSRYEMAVSDGASEDELTAIRSEGKALNKTTLETFKYIQDHFIGIILTSDMVIKHIPYQSNIELISGVTAALEKDVLSNEKEQNGALDLAGQINVRAEFGYYSFSPKTCKASEESLLEDSNKGNLFCGTGKGSKLADTKDATRSLLKKSAAGEKGSYSEEIEIYNKALKAQQKEMTKTMEAETKAMKELADSLKAKI